MQDARAAEAADRALMEEALVSTSAWYSMKGTDQKLLCSEAGNLLSFFLGRVELLLAASSRKRCLLEFAHGLECCGQCNKQCLRPGLEIH